MRMLTIWMGFQWGIYGIYYQRMCDKPVTVACVTISLNMVVFVIT